MEGSIKHTGQKKRRACLFFTCGSISKVYTLNEKIKHSTPLCQKKKKKRKKIHLLISVTIYTSNIASTRRQPAEGQIGEKFSVLSLCTILSAVFFKYELTVQSKKIINQKHCLIPLTQEAQNLAEITTVYSRMFPQV